MEQAIVLITALIGLVAAAFTGTGDVSEEQQALLNDQIPGFGTALAGTTASVNGLAPAYTGWAARQSLYGALGLANPFGSPTGLVGNIGGFLGNLNPWVLIGGGLGIYWLFFRERN